MSPAGSERDELVIGVDFGTTTTIISFGYAAAVSPFSLRSLKTDVVSARSDQLNRLMASGGRFFSSPKRYFCPHRDSL
jgi:hypothetical protein